MSAIEELISSYQDAIGLSECEITDNAHAELAQLRAQAARVTELEAAIDPLMLDKISDLCDVATLGHIDNDLAVMARKWVIKARKLAAHPAPQAEQK